MNNFPAFIDLKDRKVIIAGGGEEARRKARLYVAAGAHLSIIAPVIDAGLAAEFSEHASERVHMITATPAALDFEGAVIAVIADADEAQAAVYAKWARNAGALVNVVDQPALCDFTTPSIIDRGQVTIAISTDGAAPVLGQQLRAKVEALAPARLGNLAAFAGSFRDAVKATISADQRRSFWTDVFRGPIAHRFLQGDETGAREAMIDAVNRPQAERRDGVVHIVGAGPGDPELLTLKAVRLLQDADVILHDRLVSKEILDFARRDADRIYVGKAKADHAVPQEEIEARLISLAREGKNVVRLKGGDPFVFGRGGEELDALRKAGVAAFVTPGVTAATGCAASAGMALTHRDHSQAVTFVTGHARGEAEPDLNWSALAALEHTLVIYMGVSKASVIAGNLLDAGRRAATPVAIIENGSRPDQRIVKGALADLGALVDGHLIKGPAVLVVGEVAALADDTLCETALQTERLSA